MRIDWRSAVNSSEFSAFVYASSVGVNTNMLPRSNTSEEGFRLVSTIHSKGTPYSRVSSTLIRISPRLAFWLIAPPRSEEHTSELQSRFEHVCRRLLAQQ